MLALCCGPFTRASFAMPVQLLPYSMDTAFYRGDAATTAALPGNFAAAGSLFLAVTVTPVTDGVYLYASKSQTLGKASEIAVSAATGEPLATEAIFPRGVEKADPLRPGEMMRGYEGTVTILLPLLEKSASPTSMRVRFVGLACSAVNCTPVTLDKTVDIPDVSSVPSFSDAAGFSWQGIMEKGVVEPISDLFHNEAAHSAPLLFAPTTAAFGSLPLTDSPVSLSAFLENIRPEPFSPGLEVSSLQKAVFLGFLAGIILNLMPCVLPVLGIKFGALLRHEEKSEGRVRAFRRYQIFFALGILAWFTALAGIFHSFDLAWGQIFQSPAVVLGLAVVLLLLALNLFGVLSLPLIDFRVGNPKNPDAAAFAGGFTATLLATPCGGPLLGGVLSWALMQPLGSMAIALESIGLGMAFPYLLLAAFPGLVSRLPRPGSWMLVLERLLGFLLLGTVAYLVSFLPSHILPRVAGALVLAAFGGWLWEQGANMRRFSRTLLRAGAVAAIVGACLWPLRQQEEATFWQPYSHAAFTAELGSRVLLVDFTADWCPTCKVVEATALADSGLREWKKQYDLALFRVDMTQDNPEGAALLRAVGSVSIPVIAVFSAGENANSPLVLRDVVTRGQVAKALERAAGTTRK